VSDSAISPSASDCAPIWKVKNGVANHGKASRSASTTTCRVPIAPKIGFRSQETPGPGSATAV
jgi:hypothetical protein